MQLPSLPGVEDEHENKLKEHLIRCESAIQSAKPILGKYGFPDEGAYRALWIHLPATDPLARSLRLPRVCQSQR